MTFACFTKVGKIPMLKVRLIKWTKMSIIGSGKVRMSKKVIWSTPGLLFGLIDPRTRFTSANIAGFKKNELALGFAVNCAWSILSLLCLTWKLVAEMCPRGRPWPRGRPRGHILKSLALASKVKSLALASRLQVLENWPVLGSRTALLFELLKFCEALENFCGKRFFVEIA